MTSNQRRRIVVGVDFEECGDDAIVEALQLLASGWASELHAVYALDPSQVLDGPDMPALVTEEHVLETTPGALRRRVTDVAERVYVPMLPGSLFVHARIGQGADCLEQVAADYDADLIVVGTHKRRGLERLILGSVAQRLVRTATCPVLVARPKQHDLRPKTQRPDAAYAPGEAPQTQPAPNDRPTHISTERSVEPSTTARIL